MTQHGKGGVRFSTSGSTVLDTNDTRLSRPDQFDGCWDCALRQAKECDQYPGGPRGISGTGMCDKWKLRSS